MSVVKCPSCGTAINLPEKKTGLWWGIGCLVAAVAMFMIVSVVGLLAAIAIPSFVKARDVSQRNACVNNMRQIDGAKEQAAMQHNYKPGDGVSEQEVSPYIRNGFGGLVCPRGGHYTINAVGEEPACSVHGSMSAAMQATRMRRPPPAESGE